MTKSNRPNSSETFLKISAVCLSSWFLIMLYYIFTANTALIPSREYALIAGILIECKRQEDWKPFLRTLMGGFAVSLIIFIPAMGDGMTIIDSIKVWPLMFMLMFVFIAIAVYGYRLLAKITEGIVLLQTAAVIYWQFTLAKPFEDGYHFALAIATIFFAVLALYHAFSYEQHNRTSKLFLSIWSCIVIFVLGYDNALKVFALGNIESAVGDVATTLLTLQYLLVGMSIIYIANSLLMVSVFFVGRGKESRSEHKKAMKELKDAHIGRTTNYQIRRWQALLLIGLCMIVFGGNYYYKVLPANFLIWCVFIIFPILMAVYDKLYPAPAEMDPDRPLGLVTSADYYRNRKRFK